MSKNGKTVFVAMSHRRRNGYGGQAGGKKESRVFVAMSGGVDSSVAAYLLKRQGYRVTGVFMRSYNIDGCAERDAEDARRVAEHIGIPFYVWDFEREYKKKVVEYMIEGYRRGETPNPDVMCNREIKFGIFLRKALALGADFVATGHYAAIKNGALHTARDANKDQSYFLWTLRKADLSHVFFPIGGYTKPQVRAIARKAGLPTAEKKDSQGICFLGQVSLRDFLRAYIPARRGEIIDTHGRKIGEHDGAHLYTIGQRHGLNLAHKNAYIGARRRAATLPHYVVKKDVRTNTIIVAEGEANPKLYVSEIKLSNVHSIDGAFFTRSRLAKGLRVYARVRYRQPLFPARLCRRGEKIILFPDAPQKFVARGQSVACYNASGKVYGGGVIV